MLTLFLPALTAWNLTATHTAHARARTRAAAPVASVSQPAREPSASEAASAVEGVSSTQTTAHAAPSELNLRASPLSVLFGKFTGLAEFKVNSSWTLGPTVSLGYAYGWFGMALGIKTAGAGARAHYYFDKGALTDSFYVAPEATLSIVWAGTGNHTAQWGVLDVGGTVGYQWHFSKNWNLNAGLGTQFSALLSAPKGVEDFLGKTTFLPQIMVELGYAL